MGHDHCLHAAVTGFLWTHETQGIPDAGMARLPDEVLLLVCPVLLGRGKRPFPDGAGPRELALVSSKATPSGVLINSYRHVGSPGTE